MRNLLYSLTFAFVLLLAGSAGFASFDEPGGGGTVPAFQVWLPVVGRELPWYEVYECSYLAHPILPLDGAVVSVSEPLTITFSYEEYPNIWGLLNWHLLTVPFVADLTATAIFPASGPYENPVTGTLPPSRMPPPGTYEWHISPVC